MKKNILYLLFASISLSSCEESFLDLPSRTQLSTAIFFKTEGDFIQGVNAAYAPLRNLYNQGGAGAYLMGEQRSDNTTYMFNPGFRATQNQEAIADFTNDAANTVSTAKYVNNYQIIGRANQVIARIDGVSFAEASKNNIKGQALFLRALAYFDLVQYFGKVPLHLTPVTDREGAALPLSEIDAVYTQIIKDATDAAGLLPVKSKQEAGRATQGAAKTLLANVYIVQKKWAQAETLLKEIIDSGEYSLLPDYASIYTIANKNSRESVFEVQFREGTEGFASGFIYEFLPQPISAALVASIMGAGNPQALNNQGNNIPTPDLINAYETGDKRRTASIATIEIGGRTLPYIKKYIQPHAQNGITGVNWPVYRFAEVLLMYAEVLNEGGKSNDAIKFLNQVRNRAGLTDTKATTQTDLRAAIMAERRVEFAFENKRWLDLVRTGTSQIVMSAYGARVKANPSAYYFPAGVTPPPAAYTTISTTFPLPASESLLSPYF
ncbi:MAG: RagB/SusD family nutrient uptake outer membrane protein [Spirosomataceae bacterium]